MADGPFFDFDCSNRGKEIGKEIPRKKAIERLKKKRNVYTERKSDACSLGKDVEKGGATYDDGAHDQSFYPHIHPARNRDDYGHIFYGIPGQDFTPSPPRYKKGGHKWSHRTVSIKANSVDEFVKQAARKLGVDEGVMGYTDVEIRHKEEYAPTNTLTGITFCLEMNAVWANWTGGRCGDSDKKAIEEAEELYIGHEENHKKVCEETCDDESADLARNLVGQTKDKVQSAVADLADALNRANANLDRREGAIKFEKKSNGAFIVTQTAAKPRKCVR